MFGGVEFFSYLCTIKLKNKNIMRIAIIDHDEHALFVEDIDDELLEREYNGSEQAYIDDNYDMENYSWDYIVYSKYIID